MGIPSRKLNRWTDAGLITPDQAERITAFEREYGGGRLARGMIGIGIFAILSGILSIIAANWADIPAEVKIGAHFLLNIFVTSALFYCWQHKIEHWREGLLMVFFGLNLTLIALIGQVFQLEGHMANALSLWMIISTPALFWIGRWRFTWVIWVIALLITIGYVFEHYMDDIPDFWAGAMALGLIVLLPLAMIADGNIRLIKNFNPAFADVMNRAGFILLAVNALSMSLFWYFDMRDEFVAVARRVDLTFWQAYFITNIGAGVAAAGLLIHAALHVWYKDKPAAKMGFLVAAVSTAFVVTPFILPIDNADILAQGSFILYCIFLAWVGTRIDAPRLISLAVFLAALRIFIIYCEALGGLAMTGVGLIISGAFLLGTVWAARRINKKIQMRIGG